MGGPQVTAQVWALPVLKPSVPRYPLATEKPHSHLTGTSCNPPHQVSGFSWAQGLERRTVERSQTHQPQLTPAASFDLGLPCILVRNAFQSRIAVRKLQSRVRALDIGWDSGASNLHIRCISTFISYAGVRCPSYLISRSYPLSAPREWQGLQGALRFCRVGVEQTGARRHRFSKRQTCQAAIPIPTLTELCSIRRYIFSQSLCSLSKIID